MCDEKCYWNLPTYSAQYEIKIRPIKLIVFSDDQNDFPADAPGGRLPIAWETLTSRLAAARPSDPEEWLCLSSPAHYSISRGNPKPAIYLGICLRAGQTRTRICPHFVTQRNISVSRRWGWAHKLQIRRKCISARCEFREIVTFQSHPVPIVPIFSCFASVPILFLDNFCNLSILSSRPEYVLRAPANSVDVLPNLEKCYLSSEFKNQSNLNFAHCSCCF